MAGAAKTDPVTQAIAELRELVGERRQSPTAMGRILAGLDGADREYAAKEAGLSRRTAFYLASIARAVDAGVISEADVAALGWARARALVAPAVRTLDAGQKPRRIARKTIDAALAQPARMLAAGAGRGQQRSLLEFHASPAEAKDIRRALDAYGAKRGAGPEARAVALREICRVALEQVPGNRVRTASLIRR